MLILFEDHSQWLLLASPAPEQPVDSYKIAIKMVLSISSVCSLFFSMVDELNHDGQLISYQCDSPIIVGLFSIQLSALGIQV